MLKFKFYISLFLVAVFLTKLIPVDFAGPGGEAKGMTFVKQCQKEKHDHGASTLKAENSPYKYIIDHICTPQLYEKTESLGISLIPQFKRDYVAQQVVPVESFSKRFTPPPRS
jgi:hypothetical protein